MSSRTELSADEGAARAPRPTRPSAGRSLALLVPPIAVAAVAFVLRAWRLDQPKSLYFDEAYYVPDALTYLGRGTEISWVHPPLGKWLIAAGIGLLGDTPEGWRIASLLFGSLTVLLTYLLARRLLRSRAWATVAASLVAVDGLQIAQSRIATLDVLVGTFILAGVLLLHVHAGAPRSGGGGTSGWLAGAGVMFGAALAVKWSALPVLVFAAIAILAVSPDRKRDVVPVIAFLGVVPVAVYLLSYVRFWGQEGLDVGGWVELQRAMVRFHSSGVPGHSYASSSLGWLLLKRPVSYYFSLQGGKVRHVVALGNPLLWWAFLATLPALVRTWLRRSDRAADVILLGFAATYVPWLLVRRTSFLYYLTPLVPFMAVGVTWALQRIWRSRLPASLRRGGVITYLAATAVAATLLFPIWTGLPIGYSVWQRLIVFPGWR